MSAPVSRRAFLQVGGALVVGFTVPSMTAAQRLPRTESALGKTLDVGEVDGFIAVNGDGSVTIFSGKVDLGQGLRIAIPQMAAEELGIGVERIAMLEKIVTDPSPLTAMKPSTSPTSSVLPSADSVRGRRCAAVIDGTVKPTTSAPPTCRNTRRETGALMRSSAMRGPLRAGSARACRSDTGCRRARPLRPHA